MGGLINETTIAVIAGIGVFITLVAFAQALMPSDPMAARLRSHKKRRDTLREELLGNSAADTRRAARITSLKQVLDRLKLLRGDEARKTSEQLAQAGWRSRDALAIYLGIRLASPFIGAVGSLVAVWLFLPEATGMHKMLAVVGAVLVFGFAPVFGLKRAIKRRQHFLRKQLPDGLNLLVICTESGLSMDAAFARVARELGFSSPHLADEIGLTSVELGFLLQDGDTVLEVGHADISDHSPLKSAYQSCFQPRDF